MIRATALLTAAASVLLLAACDGDVRVETSSDSVRAGDLKTLARLDCPEREDNLRLVSAAPDGLACDYAGEGAEVRMRLVTLNGRSADAMLTPYETELRGLMPARATTSTAPGILDTDTGVIVGVETNDDEAHVRLPGLSIDAEGDRAQIRIGNGVVIDANDTDSTVNIVGDNGNVLVNADESGAEIRTSGDEDGDLRRSFLLASDTPSAQGWKVVGYEARGPAAGPIVVAVVKGRGGDDDGAVDAMKDLVRKTVGR